VITEDALSSSSVGNHVVAAGVAAIRRKQSVRDARRTVDRSEPPIHRADVGAHEAEAAEPEPLSLRHPAPFSGEERDRARRDATRGDVGVEPARRYKIANIDGDRQPAAAAGEMDDFGSGVLIELGLQLLRQAIAEETCYLELGTAAQHSNATRPLAGIPSRIAHAFGQLGNAGFREEAGQADNA
jgi:hypothetical protein